MHRGPRSDPIQWGTFWASFSPLLNTLEESHLTLSTTIQLTTWHWGCAAFAGVSYTRGFWPQRHLSPGGGFRCLQRVATDVVCLQEASRGTASFTTFNRPCIPLARGERPLGMLVKKTGTGFRALTLPKDGNMVENNRIVRSYKHLTLYPL